VICGRDSRFCGTQGTAVVELFGAAAAWTGANEKTLARLGDSDFEKVYLYPNSHAGYYPGAKPIAMKVLFRKSDGRVLGARLSGRSRGSPGPEDQHDPAPGVEVGEHVVGVVSEVGVADRGETHYEVDASASGFALFGG
jgi:hypothetical protein